MANTQLLKFIRINSRIRVGRPHLLLPEWMLKVSIYLAHLLFLLKWFRKVWVVSKFQILNVHNCLLNTYIHIKFRKISLRINYKICCYFFKVDYLPTCLFFSTSFQLRLLLLFFYFFISSTIVDMLIVPFIVSDSFCCLYCFFLLISW